MKISGKIDYVGSKPTSTGKNMYSLKINNVFYSGLGTTALVKGDYAEIEYVEKGQYKNIVKTNKIDAPKEVGGAEEGARLRRITDLILKACDMFIAGKIERKEIGEEAIALNRILNELSQPVKSVKAIDTVEQAMEEAMQEISEEVK